MDLWHTPAVCRVRVLHNNFEYYWPRYLYNGLNVWDTIVECTALVIQRVKLKATTQGMFALGCHMPWLAAYDLYMIVV